MPNTTKSIKIPYATEGVIRSAQLYDTIAPENSAQLAINGNFDKIGAFTTRPGITQYAIQLGGSIISLGTLSVLNSVNDRLLAQVGNIINSWDGAAWTAVRTLLNSNKARYAQFLNVVWTVNGNNGDPVETFDGTTYGTTFVPALFPKGDYISAGFDGRIWVADKSTGAIYFTDQYQFTPPATYTFTYDPANNFIKDISPLDGDPITGFFRVPRALLLFKQNHIFRIYGAYSVDPYPAYNVGTFSQESIVQAKDGVYFHHSSGFYKFTYGAQPTEISRRVIDFVQAIPRSSYENVVGIYDGRDAVKWSVGQVTVEGVTYRNCMMRYTISTQVWTIYDYAGNNITALVRYDDGTNLNQIAGTFNGKVGTLDTGTTDFGDKIYYETIDRWRSFTDMYAKSKAVSGMNFFTENAGGAELQYQIEKSQPNEWIDIGKVKDGFDTLMPNFNSVDFNSIRFRIRGYTSGTPIIFYGLEILALQDKGFDEN